MIKNPYWVEITDRDSIINTNHSRLMIYDKKNMVLLKGFSEWDESDGTQVLVHGTGVSSNTEILGGAPASEIVDDFRWFTLRFTPPEFDPVKFGLEIL